MYLHLAKRTISTLLALAVGGLALAVAPTGASAATTFNVRDFGATGDGSTNDTAAINRAIVAVRQRDDREPADGCRGQRQREGAESVLRPDR